jgi:hypothetical protein
MSAYCFLYPSDMVSTDIRIWLYCFAPYERDRNRRPILANNISVILNDSNHYYAIVISTSIAEALLIHLHFTQEKVSERK